MELLRDRSAEFEQAGVRRFGISRDSPWTHIAWMQALDLELPAALGLERRGGARGFGHRRSSTAGWRTSPGGRRSSSTRAVRSAAHGATRRRGARLGRAARGRAGFVAPRLRALPRGRRRSRTWPALRDAPDELPRAGPAARGEVAPGDHLQTAYQLWLPGHQLERGRRRGSTRTASSRRRRSGRTSRAGRSGSSSGRWTRCFGTVARVEPVRPARPTSAPARRPLPWLRELRAALRRGARRRARVRARALPGRRSAGGTCSGRWRCCCRSRSGRSSAGGRWLALGRRSLRFRSRARCTWRSARSPSSSSTLLAPGGRCVGARRRGARRLRRACSSALTAIAGSVGAGGRSFAQVERYSAELLDFVARDPRHGFETFVFLGWLVPLARARRARARARGATGSPPCSGSARSCPFVLALGANMPVLRAAVERLPGLSDTRVPAGCCRSRASALAALVAFAVASRAVALRGARRDPARRARPRSASTRYRATGRTRTTCVLRARTRPGPPARAPVFLPEPPEGSIYLYYAMQAPRERPTGYSTTAPPGPTACARDCAAAGSTLESSACAGSSSSSAECLSA